MDFNSTCNGACTPPQIINLEMPVQDISTLKIYNECGCEYSNEVLQFAYSLDGVCWSCYMNYKEALLNTIELKQDFFIRVQVKGAIGKIELNSEQISGYSTELVGCFQFTAAENSNTYNPYANMDAAVSLQQQLAESVSQLVGIPCYYIELKPDQGGKDLTFKEYALMHVEAIKQVKIVIQDNQMPSSKPEFSDWGLDWQTDWEVEVTKGSFATAFGNTAQPMEGDLVYIPMMKRMWMVNGAYEEKKDGFMWIATTFKLTLVKYQEKDSVVLGDAQEFVDSIVKTKYEDLFGEDINSTLDSGEAATDSPKFAAASLYPVFESDATRKYITCDTLDIRQNSIYEEGTLVSDSMYEFMNHSLQSRIIYQNKYCGDEMSMSFIIRTDIVTSPFEGPLVQIGNFKIMIHQEGQETTVYLNKNKDIAVKTYNHTPTFITLKISKQLNLVEMFAYKYTYNSRIPVYKLQNYHYYFDIDNPISSAKGKFNVEYIISERTQVELNDFYGWITNFKLFDLYNDNTTELLQMYPTHQHLLINDTARRIVELPGVKPA